MFDIQKDDLKDILRKVDEGRLQLPDFQRDYVWSDADVQSLIASIANGFPVGALLTLETGGQVNFKPRAIEGANIGDARPEELLLDGQQRMTSLYQAMFSANPVRTKTPQNKRISRYYYIDIEKAIANGIDFEEAIIGFPADRIRRQNFGRDIETDLSQAFAEFKHNLFPLNRVFDNRDWLYDWRDYWRAQGEDVADLERDFYRYVIDVIDRYKMPVICLDRDNSREAICAVFEKVNVGGQKLNAFELVTAIYAGQGFDLREDWLGKRGQMSQAAGSA